MYKEMINLRCIKWVHVSRQFVFALTVGMLSGFTFAYLMLLSSSTGTNYSSTYWSSGNGWFSLFLSDSNDPHSPPHSPGELVHQSGPALDPGAHDHSHEPFHQMEDKSVADELTQKVRVLCWIMTGPKNHEKKAKHVKATWGKRCNVLLFMSSVEDKELPTVRLPVGEGRDNLWAKTKAAFRYVYEKHRNDADWFLKADDDTYVVVENLRYMLAPYKTTDPLYFGCRFKPFVKQGYMSGGAGYVLSSAALKRFVNDALPNPKLCSPLDSGSEDVEMGRCLERVNVRAMDTRDSLGRGRFFPFVPESHLIPKPVNKDFWYWKYIYYESKQGMECCSDNAVSFHYVPPYQMYVLEYLIYHLRPYGISYHVDMPPSLAATSSNSSTSDASISKSKADEALTNNKTDGGA